MTDCPSLVPPPADLDIFNLDVGDQPDDIEEEEDDEFLDTMPLRHLYPDELAAFRPAQQAAYTIQLVQHQQTQAREEQMWALSTAVLDADEPTTYAEAMSRPDADLWNTAIKAEYQSLQTTGTYRLTHLPAGRQAIGCKWVFKIKRHADGSIDRYKARLVAKGFSQKEGLDYKETFAPVAKFASIRTHCWRWRLTRTMRSTRWTSKQPSSMETSTWRSTCDSLRALLPKEKKSSSVDCSSLCTASNKRDVLGSRRSTQLSSEWTSARWTPTTASMCAIEETKSCTSYCTWMTYY